MAEFGRKLKIEQRKNEKARHRIIGLSVETRPDFIDNDEIKRLRNFGTTMVELGVQSVYDNVLKLNKRNHNVNATIEATKLLKDAGFKVLYQIMPNLLGSSQNKDKEMFEKLFKNPYFQPDLLKIYPCAVFAKTKLYDLWKKNKYKPYTKKQLTNLIKTIKKSIPFYVRIQRISRDVPSPSIIAGAVKTLNLRQLILNNSKKEGWKCKCIRCREIKEDYNPKEKVYLFRENYKASDGKEIFLSFCTRGASAAGGENIPGYLYSLLRLRITSENQAVIREIHTYGQVVPLSKKIKAPQHRGLGKKLVEKAEKIAKKEFGLKEISVISGVGVRDYFRKLGYKLENTYMIKFI
jgi:elongator complex protein 3